VIVGIIVLAAAGSVGRGANNRKVGSTLDAVACRCTLGKDTKCYFPLWGQALYLLWWPSLTKVMQTELTAFVLEWYARHRA